MVQARDVDDQRIPATIVTGYLGAGKTSLVNSILSDLPNKKYAIIVNEFGEIGIDGELIQSGNEELIELSNGCICCVVRGDLIRTLRSLAKENTRLDGVIIETTGLANPSPVIQTFLVDQVIGAQFRIDSVIVVVDAAHITTQLETSPDAADQIAFSDLIVLNKIDASPRLHQTLETELKAINPFAKTIKTNHAKVSTREVLNQQRFDLKQIEDQLPTAEPDDHDHNHTDGITSVSLIENTPLNVSQIEHWLTDLLAKQGVDILRTKGVLDIQGESKKFVLQSVNMMMDGDFTSLWDTSKRQSKLVVIGRRLDPITLQSGFSACRAHTTILEK